MFLEDGFSRQRGALNKTRFDNRPIVAKWESDGLCDFPSVVVVAPEFATKMAFFPLEQLKILCYHWKGAEV
jgi:hypothetical protein